MCIFVGDNKQLNKNKTRKLNNMNTKFIQDIKVLDPDTNNLVEVSIFKLASGGLVGIDTSFLSNTDDPVYSPYDENVVLNIN